MIYIIKRETDLPFDLSIKEVHINNEVYDLVEGHKNTPLQNISDFVLDDNNMFLKIDPRIEQQMKQQLKTIGIEVQDLLLG